MSQAVNVIAANFPGCVPSEGRCLPHLGIAGRVHSQIKIGHLKCTSGDVSFVCNANSSGHRRNPDFSRNNNNINNNNRHGFSRNRNSRQNEQRDRYENHDDSELLSSKNGPLLSLSGTPKSQATAAPGPREREIVELFRKVQAQLRERAAKKEDKKIEGSSGKGKESETVDSLLKLLRKHSVEQGKRKDNDNNNSVGITGLSFDKPEQNSPDDEDKISSILSSNSRVKAPAPDSKTSSLSRPPSSFRRKSPVPNVKYQQIYSGEDTANNTSYVDFTEKVEKVQVESPDPEPTLSELESESDVELELEPKLEINAESAIVDEHVFDDVTSNDEALFAVDAVSDDEDLEKKEEKEDLSALKLVELRALAKSRGLKGFSKMKKSELVELLSN